MSEKKQSRRILSVAIDPLLLEGGRTVREIAKLLETQLVKDTGEKYTLPVLINNINSRVFTLQERGFKLEKSDKKVVRLVKPVATETVSV